LARQVEISRMPSGPVAATALRQNARDGKFS